MVNIRYSKGNLTIKDLSGEYGVSTRTIYRKLTKSYKEELPSLLIRPVVVLDVTYWGRNFGVVIMKDSLSVNGLCQGSNPSYFTSFWITRFLIVLARWETFLPR